MTGAILERRESAPTSPAPARLSPVGRRFRPREFGSVEAVLAALTLLAAVCTVWIVFDQLTLFSGAFGFVVAVAAVFLLYYYVLNCQLVGRRAAADRVVGAIATMAMIAILIPLVLLVAYLFDKGLHLLDWHFLTATQQGVPEVCPAHATCPTAGVFHAIIGTFEQVGFAVLMGVPVGIATAVFLNEVGGRIAHAVRVMVTAMSGLPAIVAGIFIYSIWVIHFHFSGLAGSFALAVLLLPTVTRGTEEVLKVVPQSLREAAAALGAPQWRTVWSVVLPTARSGMLTAALLGIAVAMGETAPLLFTVFGSTSTNWDLFGSPQASLPLLVYTAVKKSQTGDVAFGYTAALVLFLLVFFVFLLARLLGSPWLGRLVRRRSDPAGGRRGVQARQQPTTDPQPTAREGGAAR